MALTTIDDRGLKTPIDLLDNEKIRFGTGNDLELYHSGSDSWIKHDGTGLLVLATADLQITNVAGSEQMIRATADGSVSLYYDNSLKIQTKSYGVNMPDNSQLYFGTGDDLVIKHDGSNSWITNSTGVLVVGSADFQVANVAGSEQMIRAYADGAVELYHNNVKRLETSATGVTIPNTLTVSDGANLDGDIKFKGSGNGDDFFWDKSADQLTLTDSRKIRFGDSGDLEIYHDGSNSYLTNSTNALYLRTGTGLNVQNAGGTETYLYTEENGAVFLRYDNSTKLETASWGVDITGTIRADDYTAQDDHKFKFGNSNDLQIWHDAAGGNYSYIMNYGAALLKLGSDQDIILGKTGNETFIHAKADGAVELYYDNAKVFYTQSYGATVKRPSGGNTVFEVIGSEGQDAEINMFSDDGDDDADQWKIAATSNEFFLKTKATGSLVSPVKIIGDTGVVHIDKAGGFTGLSNTVHGLRSTDNNWTQYIVNSHSSEPYGLLISFNNSYPDNSTSRFLQCGDTQTSRFVVYSDGDVANHDGTYGQTSDIKLKENIVDANSQWDDIKAVRVRNFNFKIDGSSKKQIGVVAQELETVCPGLVKDNPDLDENNKDLGTTTKSVKSSILYMKAIKALQEAITRIETLETEVAALKAK